MYIAFEGIDGSGKSTHIKKLYDFLKLNNYEVDISRGEFASKQNPIGQLFKELLRNDNFPSDELSLLMKLADIKYIYEYNSDSNIFIFDRHLFSIYSDMHALKFDIDKYDEYFKLINDIDRVYYFDVNPSETYERKEGQITYAETGGPLYSKNRETTKENFIKFQSDLKDGFGLGFLKYIDPSKIVKLEGSKSIEENFSIIKEDIILLLEKEKNEK